MNTFEQRRQVTYYRAAFHDMPVAGPMDGAAYGEYLKSKGLGMIIGVVASIVTMGAAMPMLASTVLATQIAGGVMMAGGVMSGVGAVTGNKKLMKIGGIMSLAGGVGALASSALGAGTSTATGALASGSGSEAVSTMAGSFMESANSVGGAIGIGDIYNAEGAANAASGAGFKEAAAIPEAGGIDLTGTAETSLPIDQSSRAAELANADIGGAAVEGAGTVTGDVTGAAVKVPDTSTIKLADANAASTVSDVSGAATPADAARSAQTGGQIDPADINNGPNPGKGYGGFAGDPNVKTVADTSTLFGMNKTELMKTGAGMLEKAGAAAFTPDETAKIDAMTDYYKATTTKLTTEDEIAKYKLANAKQQVVMISANDPQMEQKVAAAAAAGHPVAFIPAVAAGGVTPTAAGAQMAAPQAQQIAAQTPVRPATYV